MRKNNNNIDYLLYVLKVGVHLQMFVSYFYKSTLDNSTECLYEKGKNIIIIKKRYNGFIKCVQSLIYVISRLFAEVLATLDQLIVLFIFQ